MRKIKSLSLLCVILGLLVILTGCPETVHMGESNQEQNQVNTGNSNNKAPDKGQESVKPKGMVYFNYFDTVSNIYCYANETQENFEAKCNGVTSILGEYHQLFDIYYEYSGVANLRTINLNAGKDAVEVDEKLIDFLLYAKELYQITNGEMNIMMGSVLKLWHNCREEASTNPSSARIPTEQELAEANAHTSISSLEIDEVNNTVRITDPEASIDVGALGKGYATEKAAEYLRNNGGESYVLNIGGNIRIIGHKPDGSGWKTGIKNPANTSSYAAYLTLADTSCVTSGNYERYYMVKGQKYHHIIDKDTLMPADFFTSVTIITKDSGLADALSTALFSMSYEDGLAMVEKIGGVDVLWITADGTQYMTPGLSSLIAK